jgi:hypothetical protein
MEKRLYAIVVLGWLLVASPVSGLAQAGEEIGIDRSNLTRESEAVQQKTLRDIHALHATWFRDVLSGTTPQMIAKFVTEVRLAKQYNLKFLANVLAAQADYDEGYQSQNAGEEFRKRCGWPQGSSKLSQINLAKLAQRLRIQFDAVKAANLTIDAFEIGNEVDWICFNGDVPDGHTPTEAELTTAVRGYAHFLKVAAEVIRDPHYFPNAKIITLASPIVATAGISRRIISPIRRAWWHGCETWMGSTTWIMLPIMSTAMARIFTQIRTIWNSP